MTRAGAGAGASGGAANADERSSPVRPVWTMPGVVAMLACCLGIVLADEPLIGSLWFAAAAGAGLLCAAASAAGLLAKSGVPTGVRLPPGLLRAVVRGLLVGACVLVGISRGGAVLQMRADDDLAAALRAAASQRILTVSGAVESAEASGPGTATGGPNPWQGDAAGGFTAVDHSTLVLKVTHAGSGSNPAGTLQPVSGRIKLALPPGISIAVGESICATGVLLPARAEGVPGQQQAERAARSTGMAGTLVCRDEALIRRTEPPGRWAHIQSGIWSTLETMRGGARRLLGLGERDQTMAANVPIATPGSAARARRPETDAFIAALLLGEYQPSIRETADRFARLGLLHALSISGFHIAVLAVVAGVVLRAVGVLGRANRLVLVLIVLGYVAMLPAAAPITRSALTMGLGALVMSFGRQYNSLNLLGFTGAALALVNPVDVFTPGFALTFVATGALLRFSGPAAAMTAGIGGEAAVKLRGALATRWTPRPLLLAIVRGGAAAALIGGIIWLLTAPTIMVFSGWLSVLGVLISLALAPLISGVLVLALLGLLAGGLAEAGTWLAGATGGSAGWAMEPARALAGLTLRLAEAADGVAGVAILLPPFWGDVLAGTPLEVWGGWVPALWATLATGSIWLVLEGAMHGARARVGTDLGTDLGMGARSLGRIPLAAACAVLCAAAALAILLVRADPAATGAGRVDRFELGSGTATLVRGALPDGAAGVLLIDPGARGPNGCGAAAGAIRRAVRAVGCGRVPTVLVTGAGVQQAGALLELATPLGVRKVILAAEVGRFVALSPDRPLAVVVRQLRGLNVEVVVLEPGETLRLGELSVTQAGEALPVRMED